MKEIQLTQGYAALVDDEDYEWLNRYKWQSLTGRATVYAVRRKPAPYPRNRPSQMHREILKAPDGVNVDHINGNGLDNRRCNLRLCTDQQNNWNARTRKDNSSGYKGVSWHKHQKKWQAQIGLNGKRISLGYFKDKLEAKQAYDAKAKEWFGEFACLG